MRAFEMPPGHTEAGGVLVGSEGARKRLILFEDPQCPFCRQFEEVCGDGLRRETAAGAVAVEYRIRSFLGEESVRGANALAGAAAIAGAGAFDGLRRQLFAEQPSEHSGGFSTEVLVKLGSSVGLTDPAFVAVVREARYERWVREIDEIFEQQDAEGTPFALLDGRPVDSQTMYDPEPLGALIRD